MRRSSASGTQCSNAREPEVERSPFVWNVSLWVIGSPCSSPWAVPRAVRSSAAAACPAARSKSVVTTALIGELRASIAAM